MSNLSRRFDALAIDASRADVSRPTGTEWYSREIINAIARKNARPELILYRRSGFSGNIGHRVISRSVNTPRMWTHIGLSAAMLRDRPNALFVPAHVIPAVHPRVSVVTVHDLGYIMEPEAHPWKRRKMLDATTRWNVKAATRIIAISQQTRQDLVKYYDADERKIDIVHHGLNHRKFRPLSGSEISPVLTKYSIEPPYILFLSTVQPRKNIVRLIEAFALLDLPELKLVIAGQTGWFGTEIETYIDTHEVSNRISRLGYVADADVPALYAGAILFALPSLYEGFGMGILEAMACGCPVVTSNLSSMPEIAGEAAVLVDPYSTAGIAEGLAHALDSDERLKMISKGLERAKSFNWAKSAEQTLSSLYQANNEATT